MGWRYRLTTVLGVAVLTALSVVAVNNETVQATVASLPVLSRLPMDSSNGVEFSLEVLLTAAVVTGACIPLYKSRPRRILDIIALAHKRIVVAVFALATIGYFDYTYRLPRRTLLLLTPILLVVVPLWFIWLRKPNKDAKRTIVVGDDPAMIKRIIEVYDGPLLGYVAPPTPYRSSEDPVDPESHSVTDGGQTSFGHAYVGGISRFEDIIQKHGVDSAILAFDGPNRAEFFGALHTCYEQGIGAKTHIGHINSLIVDPTSGEGPIVDIDLEPWNVQDRVIKRLFDVVFAGTALLFLSPVILLIAVALKVEGHGPVFFSQERTYRFGDTFMIYKFRTLKPVDEDVDLDIDGDRRTPLGDFLRRTHLDEIPQLWFILTGKMSVVGPRPAIPELESDYESQLTDWRQRWFVKPGLTGLAQIHNATGKEPERKLHYDIAYIQNQSFIYDMQIVLRQIWDVSKQLMSIF